ncbi:DUF4870 domain-containing protein [Planctomonas deserti]|uniref:DUF4870 domain-containing protein n=1 Tax=Planctomonas deserti TaxID=2144185 RepID=UPI000D3D81A1|nr:DUF4870 domain-containing protein [Planctomonas deserti]
MTDPNPPQYSMQPAPPLSPAEDRQWASLAHFGGILGWLPPLILWLIFKDRGRLTNQEGKESLNFQITVSLAVIALYVVGAVLMIILIGGLFFALAWAVQIAGVVFAIIAGVKVNAGGSYRYPVAFRFIK